MPFNWFNRQYQKPDAEPETPAPEPTPMEEKAGEPPTQSASQEAIAQDYLTWAKAAYQNIQKRKQEQGEEASPPVEAVAEVPTVSAEPEAPVEVAEPEVAAEPTELEVPAVAETPEPVAISEPDAPIENVAPMTEAIAAPEIAPAASEEIPEKAPVEVSIEAPTETSNETPAITSEEAIAPTTEPAETPEPVAKPALPLWLQADAERQERLERLKAEAEAEAQAEAAAAAARLAAQAPPAPTPEPVPDAALDENFLWSASVLASQGRRPDQVDIEEITWLKRLRQGLDKTRRSLINQLKAIVGQGPLNEDAVMEIEALLLQADVGVEATDYIIESLQSKLRQEALPPDQAIAYLKQILRDMLERPYETYSPTFAPESDTLNIWLITGVNGAGKTTTIGKIAHVASKSGYRCLIGAADTFRAAAVEQVKVWGQRSNVEVIANPGKNTDPAAVVFDAIAAAQARNTELLLIDTAGRLQNKKNLMDELSKIRRIIDKKAPNARIESLLVLDSTLGQNGLKQAEVFSQAAQLSGVVLTKLDGTAKGGIALAVVQQLGLPIRFIGAGEGIEDLRPFSSYEFVEALLSG